MLLLRELKFYQWNLITTGVWSLAVEGSNRRALGECGVEFAIVFHLKIFLSVISLFFFLSLPPSQG